MRNQVTLRFVFIYDISQEHRVAGLHALESLLAAGKLVHAVGAKMPLADIAAAHDRVEQGGTLGNLVLSIP